MAREFDERERASVERDRRIRQTINRGKGYPYGDRYINPQKKETAHEYFSWMTRAPSVSMHAGAYLGNLEREEHVLGINSYPPDHPRHAHVEAGHYYPGGVELPKEAYMRHSRQTSPAEELRIGATKALGERPRPNTVETTCDNCGHRVGVGEGRIVRRPDRYVTIHNNEQ